jgi:hypothetical protein
MVFMNECIGFFFGNFWQTHERTLGLEGFGRETHATATAVAKASAWLKEKLRDRLHSTALDVEMTDSKHRSTAHKCASAPDRKGLCVGKADVPLIGQRS